MPQAIVDPAEVRRFAMNLKRFNGDLMNQLAVLHGQLLTLSNTWRDQEQIKFTGSAARWRRNCASQVAGAPVSSHTCSCQRRSTRNIVV